MSCKPIGGVGPCKMPKHTPVEYSLELSEAYTKDLTQNYVTFKLTFRLNNKEVNEMFKNMHPLTFAKLIKIFAKRMKF